MLRDHRERLGLGRRNRDHRAARARTATGSRARSGTSRARTTRTSSSSRRASPTGRTPARTRSSSSTTTTPGIELVRTPAFSHTFSDHHPIYASTTCSCPESQRLGTEGDGMRYSHSWFRRERLMIAARCCRRGRPPHRGGHRVRLDAHDRRRAAVREADGPGDARRQRHGAVGRAADHLRGRARRTTDGEDLRSLQRAARSRSCTRPEAANRIADRVLQILGGRGYMRENAAERFFRELRVDRIWEGASEIQRLIIARAPEARPRGHVARVVAPAVILGVALASQTAAAVARRGEGPQRLHLARLHRAQHDRRLRGRIRHQGQLRHLRFDGDGGSRLLAGRTGYDVVVHAERYSARSIPIGVYQPLDKSKLPTGTSRSPGCSMPCGRRPGNRYGVPYLWGTTVSPTT